MLRVPTLYPELWKSDLTAPTREELLTRLELFAAYMQAVSETYNPPLFEDEWIHRKAKGCLEIVTA